MPTGVTETDEAMAHRVRVFMRPTDQSASRYIGELDLPDVPRPDGRIAFEHEGRMKTGRVERIVPTD